MIEASRRGLLDTPIGEMSANVLDVDPNERRSHQLIAELLDEDDVRVALTAPFWKRQINEGNIVLGEDPFEHTPHYQCLHEVTNTLTVGVPGCGKTTLIQAIAPQFAVHGCNVLLVDSEKEELRSLVPVFEKYGQSLNVLQGRVSSWNPLEFSGLINSFEYLEHIALTIGSALDVPEPGVRLLKEVIYKLYFKFGVFEGKRFFPVLFEVREEVAKSRNCNPLTREALLARLDSVLLTMPGLRYRVGENAEQLSKNNYILECSGMAPPARDLLVGTIITREFLRRKQLRFVNSPANWAVVIDDGQRISENPQGHLAQTINIIRSTGITLSFFVQTAHLVAPEIISNCSTKFCGILASAEDNQFLAKTLLLTNEQKEWLATKLQRGQFLCQLGTEWRTPFVLQVRPGMVHDYLTPVVPVPHNYRICDEGHTLNSTNQLDSGINLVEAKEYRNWVPPEWRLSQKIDSEKTKSKLLDDKGQEFLSEVHKSPGQPCSSYTKNLSFSQKAAISIRKELVEKGLLHEEYVRTKKYGRTAKLLTVTKSGEDYLKKVLKRTERP